MIIKKYKNRKYYCVEKSRFVGLDFIIGLIERKDEFVIVDSENEDITNRIILKMLRRELKKNAGEKKKEKVV